ncbi:Non-hemolytic phospholipase C precursor [Enhygromyxa salina]|uniref:Non-hemolytic phospholipase C n=1 Tax=Enhygromyxa salina TaxID=215803 RepID=A0A2S9XB95_9BACT|nr:alkaline phosphatase family protein [Enhygromyxa salina]PRP90116.1 Non-hemolytic phospholipase C precursor [Enhygromyxa salina]
MEFSWSLMAMYAMIGVQSPQRLLMKKPLGKHETYIRMQNNIDQRVLVQLYLRNLQRVVQSKSWVLEPGETSPKRVEEAFIAAYFSQFGLTWDGWFCVLHVPGGSEEGTYISRPGGNGSIANPEYLNVDLSPSDAGVFNTFTISTSDFQVNLAKHSNHSRMNKVRDFRDVQHVFLLMLENRSFDQILGNSGLPDIAHASAGSDYNEVDGQKIYFASGAKPRISVDPHHEFDDILEQLCGKGAKLGADGSYPPILKSKATLFAQQYRDIDPEAGPDSQPSLDNDLAPGSDVVLFGSGVPNVGIEREGFSSAMCRVDGGQALLSILDSVKGNVDLSLQVAEATSPAITRLNGHSDNWVVAYVDPNAKLCLARNLNTPPNYGVAHGTSPAMTALSNGSDWVCAFVGADDLLQFYTSSNNLNTPSVQVLAGTSPSISACPNGDYVAAIIGADYHVELVYGNGDFHSYSNCKPNPQTRPSVAVRPNGDWAFAYQNTDNQLTVYTQIEGQGKRHSTGIPMMASTSPSLVANGNKGWFVAIQGAEGAVQVLTHEAVSLYIGEPMDSTSSPQLSNRASGGWQLAYKTQAGNPALINSIGDTPIYAPPSDIMTGFNTPVQLPVLYTLADKFEVCDKWFSSLPGPTWPNRFFSLCASSGDLDDSPSGAEISESMTFFEYEPKGGTMFTQLPKTNWPGSSTPLTYRIYNDALYPGTHRYKSQFAYQPDRSKGSTGSGWMPIGMALEGASWSDWYSLDRFARDLNAPYEAAFTLIEPHYGNARGDTYQGGSSQHPRDDYYGGEALIRAVYETLRSSPLWFNSLLIITYDEHGGFYDSRPPGPAVSPQAGLRGSKKGFNFETLGPRVPAVLVSPLVGDGKCSTTYDHAVIPATIEDIFDMKPMSDRDAASTSLTHRLKYKLGSDEGPRTDCPRVLPPPAKPYANAEQQEAAADSALPEQGNLRGAMQIALKLALQLSSDEERPGVIAHYKSLQTRQDLDGFMKYVAERLEQAQAERDKAEDAAQVKV